MIEAIIDHFQKAGFTVRIYPHLLVICKKPHEDISVDWRIPDVDLTYAVSPFIFFGIADRYMYMIEQAIATQRAPRDG